MFSRIESRPGIPGMEGCISGTRITLLNASSELPQTNSVTIGTVVNSTEYRVIIDGIVSRYTSGAAATASAVGAGLAEAVNLNGLGVSAVADPTTGNLTLTGTAGIPYTLALGGGDEATFVAAQNSAASTSQVIKFGRVVVTAPTDELRIGRLPSNATDRVRGISMHLHKQQVYEGGAYYDHAEEMCVKAKGSIWVQAEDGIFDRTLPLLYRYAAAGAYTELGTITTTADAGTTILPTANFLSIDGDLAEITIDLI